MSIAPPVQFSTPTPSLAEIGAASFKAAAPISSTTCTTTANSFISQHMCNKFAIFFVIVAIIVLIIVILIATSANEWYNDLKKHPWGNNSIWFSIILSIVVLLMAGATYYAYNMTSDEFVRNAILFSFTGAMIFLIIMFVVFFVEKNLSLAFYLSLVFIFIAFIQMTLIFQANMTAGYCTLPYFIGTILLTVIVWNIWQSNSE
jgi:tryptophan-rich sensory protein